MKVSHFYTEGVVTASPDTTVLEAAKLMRAQHVGDVVIVDADQRPRGILTDRDIVLSVLATELDAGTITVGDAMSYQLATVVPDDDLEDAIEQMVGACVRRLPVVDADNRLVGVISLDDIVYVLGRYMDRLSRLADTQRFRERTTRL